MRNAISQFGLSISLSWIARLIFILGCIVYGISSQSKPQIPSLVEGAEIPHVAISLLQTGSFSNPFYVRQTGPTAHTPPVYVLLYALIAGLFGADSAGIRVLTALNIAFLALQLALLPVLSDRLGLGVAPGVLAAFLGLIIQPYRVLLGWEALFLGALLICACVMTWNLFNPPVALWRYVLLGMVWGIVILTNPQSILLLIAWASIAAMENARELLPRVGRAALVTFAAAALVCLPWFVRNFVQFHSVFFVRDNFGLELFTSNNPCAGPTAFENLMSGCHFATHPYGNAVIADDMIEKGEIRFNQEMRRRALSWIASNPRAFASLTARRFVRFWFPFLGSFRYSIPMGILTVLSLVGIVWMYRERRGASLLLASTLILYPLAHYLVQFEARYRYPIFWATLLPASYAILKIIRSMRNPRLVDAPVVKATSELIPV